MINLGEKVKVKYDCVLEMERHVMMGWERVRVIQSGEFKKMEGGFAWRI